MHLLTPSQQRLWNIWLVACMAMVVLMIGVGGVTRLTESGLSIVEWKVFSGIFPPLSQQGWEAEFTAYQLTPEFQKINSAFALSDFKRIFWLEYIHRVLGRITGLVFVLPLAYFAVRRSLPTPYLWRMLGLSALVGVQGLIGWVMVKSGLIDDPRVNPLKLALHLGTALLLFSLLWWQWLSLHPATYPPSPVLKRWANCLLLTLIIQIFFGALVAGWDAGLTYNTFPLMNGRFIPDGLVMLEPFWRNMIENITTMQFQHRMLAMLIAVPVGVIGWNLLRMGHQRDAALLLGAYILQFVLGVLTLIWVVPVSFASLHQLGAVLLLAMCLKILHRARHTESFAHN